jgi:hypothetical protein
LNRLQRNLFTLQQRPWLWRGLLGTGLGLALLVPVIAGVASVKHLLEIADLPDCQTDTSTDDYADSYSGRLYCADEIAGKNTVGDLRDAIKLVSSIPEGDPLREAGDRRIERWSRTLLDMGEDAYQKGDLDNAMNAARAIPISTQLFNLAGDRMNHWKDTWDKAEDIYKRAKDAIDQQQWSNTISTARELLKLDNHHWATTRYQELMDQLQAAKEQLKSQKIAPKPPSQNSVLDADGTAQLKKAKTLANRGDLAGLKGAIAEAQQIFYGTPAYNEAQKLIEQWEKQAGLIEDRQHLDRANQLAQRGTEQALQAAIDEAYQVSPSRGLYNEARRRIDQWMDQLYRTRYPSSPPSPPASPPAPAPSSPPTTP